jgi:hypothetical protein
VAPEKSGLYYLWAKTPSGEKFSFPWVVAPPRPQEKVAVLASTNTWNAYNNYGGRSNYIHPAGLPEFPLVNARQELDRYRETAAFAGWRWKDEQFLPLSFDRPEPHNNLFDDPEVTGPVQGRVQCGVAHGVAIKGRVRKEGFGHDFYAEAQLHDGTLDLDSHRVLMLSIHPNTDSRNVHCGQALGLRTRWQADVSGGQWTELRGDALERRGDALLEPPRKPAW